MRWKWPYITRSGDSRNRNQPTDFAEEAEFDSGGWRRGPRVDGYNHRQTAKRLWVDDLLELSRGETLAANAGHPGRKRGPTDYSGGYQHQLRSTCGASDGDGFTWQPTNHADRQWHGARSGSW